MAVFLVRNTMPGTEDMLSKKFVDKRLDEQMNEWTQYENPPNQLGRETSPEKEQH